MLDRSIRDHAPRVLPGSLLSRALVLALVLAPGLAPGLAPSFIPGLAAGSGAHAQEPAPQQPTVDEILARHVEARGGADAWAAVQSLKLTGTYTALSEEAEFALWRQRPDSYRFDYGILGNPATEVYADGFGWMQSPTEGWAWPVPMNEPQVITARSLAQFDSPLMDAAAQGHKVELVGRSDFDGIDTWKLKVTLAAENGEAGNEETWYLDAETYLQVARELPAVDFGRAVGTQKVFYDDHREVGGLRFPFFIQSEYFIRLNIWRVEDIEVDPEIPAGLFTRPLPAGMERLASLAGTWTVKAENRPAPQAPWSDDGEVTSEIVPRLGGAVLEERLTLPLQGRPAEVVRTYTWDRFRETYRLAHTDSLSQHLNVFEGTFGGESEAEEEGQTEGEGDADADEGGNEEGGEEGGEENDPSQDPDALVLTNVDTDTPVVIGQPLHGRLVLSGWTPDGFSIEQSISTDGGETWFPNQRLTYTRAAP